jgi:hypothetical protein
VIILSVHGQTGVPPTVRDWLERWLRYKQDQPYALGVLLDTQEATQGSENPLVAYCMEIAAGAGADLFCGFPTRRSRSRVWLQKKSTGEPSLPRVRSKRPHGTTGLTSGAA